MSLVLYLLENINLVLFLFVSIWSLF